MRGRTARVHSPVQALSDAFSGCEILVFFRSATFSFDPILPGRGDSPAFPQSTPRMLRQYLRRF